MKTRNKHFHNIMKFCWSHGGYLAEIENQDQEIHLDAFLIDEAMYWLGLNDLSDEGIQKVI